MINLVELAEEGEQAPCKHGNIIAGHACYCHSKHKDAPRKCPIWRNGEEWTKVNCELFEENVDD